MNRQGTNKQDDPTVPMPELKRIRIGLLACLLLLAGAGNALHIKGGWMYYQYVGTLPNGDIQYSVVAKLFRDCVPPNTGQNDISINITIFNNSTGQQVNNFQAPLVSNYRLQKSSFSECISQRPDVCYVVLEYRTTVTVAPSANGYTASFQRCCRVNGIVNIVQPSNSLGNTYSIMLPGNAGGVANLTNSSPLFAERDTAVVCFNSSFVLDYSALDPDGDSLTYSFAPALIGASTGNHAPPIATPPPYNSLPYNGAFSPEDPFGTNVLIDPRTGIITGRAPSATGEYVVAVNIREYRGGQFIAETRKELHVNVANCTTPDADLPESITHCESFNVRFENQGFSSAINSYFWDFGVPGVTNDTSNLPTPVFMYPDTGIYTAKLVVNRGQTCSDSVTTQVRIFPGFNAAFTADGSCFSNPFNFSDNTVAIYGRVNSWRWNFGHPNTLADTSRLQSASYTYPASGNYNVQLIAGSDKGCIDTATMVLQVLDRPLLTLPFRDTLICSIDSLELKAIGTGNFTWTPATGRIFNTNTPTPTVYPTTTTTYTVTLNDRGCVASDTVRVNVLDFITLDAGNDTTICLTDAITLRPITQGLGFNWSPPNTLSNANLRNPVATPTNEFTTYFLQANLGKCLAYDSVTVRSVPYPIANAGSDTAICFNDVAVLRGAGDGNRFTWTPTLGIANANSAVTTARPNQTTNYVLNVFDSRGCPKPGRDTVTVFVIPPVQVFAGNDTSIVMGQPLQLNGSSDATFFNWHPGNGMNDVSILNPVVNIVAGTLPDGEEYFTWTLTATTPEGCTGSDDLTVRIFKTGPEIFVPNAFTPNADGRNDIIRPVLAGMRQLDYFRVYNRYGQLVYETREANRGWDGRIKGQLQNNSAFVYQVQAVDFTGKVMRKSGTFVLIR